MMRWDVSGEVSRWRAALHEHAPATMDWLVTSAVPQPPRLVLSDMDSTLINIECVDALAARLGIGDQVAKITDRAMAGELDFAASLTERVRLLAGCPLSHVQAIFAEELRLNRGAAAMVAAFRAAGARTVLVSGGFTLFTGQVADMAGMHAHFANELQLAEDCLTGRLTGPVLDAAAKAQRLAAEADALGTDLTHTLVLGDGANDLAMAEAAGIALGYHPRAALRPALDGVIGSGDLRSAALMMGLKGL